MTTRISITQILYSSTLSSFLFNVSYHLLSPQWDPYIFVTIQIQSLMFISPPQLKYFKAAPQIMCFVFIGDMTKTFGYVDLYKLQSSKKFSSISQRLDESPLISPSSAAIVMRHNFSLSSCLSPNCRPSSTQMTMFFTFCKSNFLFSNYSMTGIFLLSLQVCVI